MKKEVRKFIFVVIVICLVLMIYQVYDSTHIYRRTLYCQKVENNDENMIFKAIPGTYDSSIYGANIFIEANDNISKQIDILSNEKSIDLYKEICITFDYHTLSDKTEKDGSTYFKIDKLISIEQD